MILKKLHSRVSTALIATALILGTGAAIAVAVSNDLLGYTWSDTIGWLDMSASSSPSYAVTLNNDGTLTGYAWSDNVGWVQFGGLADYTTYPGTGFPSGAGTVSADAQVNTATGAVTGWARAIVASTTNTIITTSTTTATTSGGWTQHTLTGAGTFPISIDSTGSKIYIPTGTNKFGMSTDGGTTWVTKTISAATGVWGVSSDSTGTNLFAVTQDTPNQCIGRTGYLYTSSDGGTTWTQHTFTLSNNQDCGNFSYPVSAGDNSVIFTSEGAGGSPGYLHSSTNGGSTWTTGGSVYNNWFGGTSNPTGTFLGAIGGGFTNSANTVYVSTNKGTSWSAKTISGAVAPIGMAVDSTGTIVYVADDGTAGKVYKSTNGGTSWTGITIPGSTTYYPVAIDTSDDGQTVAVATQASASPYKGYIFISTDGGTTWTKQTSPGLYKWTAIGGIRVSSDGTKIIATGDVNLVFTYQAAGTTTTVTTSTTTVNTGWDGWISLSGSLNPSPDFTGNGGVTYASSTGSFTGYAWGSDVVGWLNFNLLSTVNAPIIVPTCTLNASSNNLSSPSQSVTLSWSSTNANSCTLKNTIGTQYSTATSSPGLTLTPGTSLNFILQCANGAQICQANQNVFVAGSGVGSTSNRLWLNNDPFKIMNNISIRTTRAAAVNWDVSDISGLGYSACTENVTSSNWNSAVWTQGKTLPSTQALNNTAQVQTLANLPVGIHTLSITCTDPSNTLSPVSTTTNSVKITVLPASINEQ